jgi:SAM-dependent methyltransferase
LSPTAQSAPRFTPGSITYDESASASYRVGRALSPQAAATWREAIAPWIPEAPRVSILDLGAGTGRFFDVLAGFAGARSVGVEPSRAMLAAADRGSARIACVVGSAERIPLRARTCDVAWLSQSFHHVRDRGECASELRRVVRPPGFVLIRGTFADRLDGFPTLFGFFPSTRRICEDLPTSEETAGLFEAHGFNWEGERSVTRQTCASLSEFAARSRLRADTSLMLISGSHPRNREGSSDRNVDLARVPPNAIRRVR